MINKISLIGAKVKYLSPYGESTVTMEIKDVVYSDRIGLRIETTNGNYYRWEKIQIL